MTKKVKPFVDDPEEDRAPWVIVWMFLYGGAICVCIVLSFAFWLLFVR